MLAFTLLISVLSLLTACAVGNEYKEDLLLHPLPQSALLAAFNFRSKTTLSAFQQQDYSLFPRSLGQILQHTQTKELHLRFSLGRWDAETWGARPRGGRREGGTGVELWAWMEAENDEIANARWLTLTNALSGLFCASLNFIDSTKTIRPGSTFEVEGLHPTTQNLHLLHGALPHEVVCTENLTPFLKLLPCKGKAGISSLLDGHKLFDASWQTMSVDVRPVCPSAHGECLVEIEQAVDMVLDIERSTRPARDPIPRPVPVEDIACNASKPYSGFDTCFPENRLSERSWSFTEIFGRAVQGACTPSASDGDSQVHLQVPSDRGVTVISYSGNTETRSPDGLVRSYSLSNGKDFDLELGNHSIQETPDLEQPLLYADRTLTGHGQEKGGVRTVLTNPSTSRSVDIVYLESLPWFMKLYLHTLRTETSSLLGTSINKTNSIDQMLYRPGIDRQRGTHVELRLTVPPASKVTLTYDFDKAILRYTEYPPDANRGFDVAPAVVRILPVAGQVSSTYLRTTSLLLPLPTPDFSMPYNVIILTSTVIAMGFGSIFNLLIRRFVAADEVDGPSLKAIKSRLMARLRSLATRFRKSSVTKKVQ